MLLFGRDAASSEVSRQLFHRAIEVIEGATALGGSFRNRILALRAVQIEAAAKGARARRPYRARDRGWEWNRQGFCYQARVRRGACSVADLNYEAAEQVAKSMPEGRGAAVPCDVTSEESVEEAFRDCVGRWGGLDILVCSAGIASSSPIEETPLAEWKRIFSVLARGYFLPSREAFRIWKRQGIGGSLIFITSKNAIAAGKNTSAYSAAKAAEQQLAPCLAEEGGAMGRGSIACCPTRFYPAPPSGMENGGPRGPPPTESNRTSWRSSTAIERL